MLELKNVTISHNGQTLMSGISLVAAKGEVTAICGPSGCGKTTLLRTIMGFHTADKGYISIEGELVTPLSAPSFRQMMAYVPQDLSFPVETVAELVELPFTLKANQSRPFSRNKAMELWNALGLDHQLYDKPISEISGGERQRIMIANLGLMEKSIVIVDEPTSALDPDSAARVALFLRQIARNGAAVIVVTHDPNFTADKVISVV